MHPGADMESFAEIYFHQLQQQFRDEEQMAQPFATVVFPTSFASSVSACSSSVVAETNLVFLNHSMGVYARFELIFDWAIDYKSVALPIELWGLGGLFSWKYRIKQGK